MEENLTNGEVQEAVQEQAEQQTETVADSSPDNQLSDQEAEQPSQGGDSNPEESLPFHKHPRWKQQVEENKALRQQLEELQTFRQQVEPLIPQAPAHSDPLPDHWKELFGETPEAYKLWQKHEDELIEKATQRIKAEEQRKLEEANAYNQHIENELKAMEDEGLKFNRNELNKFLVDMQTEYGTIPLTANGQIDFRKGLQMFQKFSPPKQDTVEAKKQVATKLAPTTTNSTPETKLPQVGSLHGRRWNEIKPLTN